MDNIKDWAIRIIETLIKEFDNPDNNPQQRGAMEDAKLFVEENK